MTNTSDSGKGDPPDPFNADKTVDALSLHSPSVHGGKNDQVSTETDQVSPKYSATRLPVNSASLVSPNPPPTLNNNAPSPTDSTTL